MEMVIPAGMVTTEALGPLHPQIMSYFDFDFDVQILIFIIFD